ncbi:hypothetical protein M5K25_005343 [Dendrobium thyrsiflorum]|uniref:Uncharacterized protein n=1 Tax=Dendrobium thyrsiflorum TaxID=117978 RepID=A0ABD0VHQ5_DENTH
MREEPEDQRRGRKGERRKRREVEEWKRRDRRIWKRRRACRASPEGRRRRFRRGCCGKDGHCTAFLRPVRPPLPLLRLFPLSLPSSFYSFSERKKERRERVKDRGRKRNDSNGSERVRRLFRAWRGDEIVERGRVLREKGEVAF